MKDICITIVNYLTCEVVLKAVASLDADLKSAGVDAQITVVDNSSNKDAMKDRLAYEHPCVTYVDAGGNVGFSKANNIGFQLTPSRYYMALNPDTTIPVGTQVIASMISYMDSHPKIGALAPQLVYPDKRIQRSVYRFDLSSILIKPLRHLRLDERFGLVKKRASRLLMHDFALDRTQPVDWALGAALMVRREVIDHVGWFDERYFMYMEDCDWCHRMWEAGWPVYYYPEVQIVHEHARDSAKVPGIVKALTKNRLARTHLASWIKYLWKWRGKHKYYGKI